jgi:hypothetical protein
LSASAKKIFGEEEIKNPGFVDEISRPALRELLNSVMKEWAESVVLTSQLDRQTYIDTKINDVFYRTHLSPVNQNNPNKLIRNSARFLISVLFASALWAGIEHETAGHPSANSAHGH